MGAVKFNLEHNPSRDWTRLVVGQLVICLAWIFSFGQFASASHVHDFDHHEPEHQICDVCILAINDDPDDSDLLESDLERDHPFVDHLEGKELLAFMARVRASINEIVAHQPTHAVFLDRLLGTG